MGDDMIAIARMTGHAVPAETGRAGITPHCMLLEFFLAFPMRLVTCFSLCTQELAAAVLADLKEFDMQPHLLHDRSPHIRTRF